MILRNILKSYTKLKADIQFINNIVPVEILQCNYVVYK